MDTAMPKPHIVVVGSLNIDLIGVSPRLPQVGESIIGSDFRRAAGGKGANQAIAAARLGAQVSLVGRLGQDEFAAALLENLRESQVEHAWVKLTAEAPTGVALILVDDAGQNYLVIVPGANGCLTSQDVEAAAGLFQAGGILLLQMETPIDAISRAIELAKRNGMQVVLNPAPANLQALPLLPAVDLLIPNETEAAILSGMPVTDLHEAIAAAGRLHELGAVTVILTLGANGALLSQDGWALHLPAFPVRVVDSTAAGDAFVAGLAVALAEGKSLEEAVYWGNAAGALACTILGAQPSLPDRLSLEALLSEHVRTKKGR
jgi:ribokinase